MVAFLPQLHPFYITTMSKLSAEDKRQLTEAFAHIIGKIPPVELGGPIQTFLMPIAQKLHSLVQAPEGGNIAETSGKRYSHSALISELSIFFRFVKPQVDFNEVHPCVSFLETIFAVIESMFQVHKSKAPIAEALSRLLRNCAESYQNHLIVLFPRILPLLIDAFTATKLPCYIWSLGHFVRNFGALPETLELFNQALSVLIPQFLEMVQQEGALTMFDENIEEFHFLLYQVTKKCPSLLLGPTLQSSVRCGVYCLSTPSADAFVCVLKYFQELLELSRNAQQPDISRQIFSALEESRLGLIETLFRGLIYSFARDRDVVEDIAESLCGIHEVVGHDAMLAISQMALSNFPKEQLSVDQSNKFLTRLAR
jgi:transportin-3